MSASAISLGVAAAICCGSAAFGGQSGSEPTLHAVRQVVFCCQTLERLDVFNGATLSSWQYNTLGLYHHALTVHGDRAVSINSASAVRKVSTMHFANGARTETPLIGVPGLDSIHSLVSEPSTGALYLAGRWDLYTLNPSTGQGTLVAPFTGSPYSWESVTAVDMDSTGTVYAIGREDSAHRYAVYTLRLATAQLTWIGEIQMPTGSSGFFLDIAIPPTGDWWASFRDTGLMPSTRGLWRITPGSWQATQVRYVDPPHEGLAFLAPTQQASYCTAKTNSLGCAPTISGEGFPSPTALSGYVLRASNVRNQSTGSLTFGISGRAVLPFGGGVNCVAPPRQRTTVAFSGGSPTGVADCSGAWQLDFNTWMSQHFTLPAGTTIQAQWLGRDAGFAPPDNWSLSNALEFVVRP